MMGGMTPPSAPPAPGRNRIWIWLTVIAAVVAVVFAVLLSKGPTGPGGLPGEISVSEAAGIREKGGFILDVRQPEEWNESHVPGSTLIPLGELKGRVAEVPRDQEIVVICRSGNRSRRGRDILLDEGFGQVTSMAGGVNAWKAEGQPTVSGP